MSKSPNSKPLQWLISLVITLAVVLGTALLWVFVSFGEVYSSDTYREADYDTVKQQLEITPQTFVEADYEYVKKMIEGK